MRTLPKILAPLALLSSPAPAFAEAGAFAEWLSADQPACIPLGAVNKAATGQAGGCLHCGGQRFESPSAPPGSPRLLRHRIAGHSRGLRRYQWWVC